MQRFLITLINQNVHVDFFVRRVSVTHVPKVRMEEARVYQVYGVMDLVLQVIIVPKEQLNQSHVQLDNGVMGIQRFVSFVFILFSFFFA